MGSLHAVVNAIAHNHIKTPRLAKERFVARCAPPIAPCALRLRFHNHAPQHLAVELVFHQQAADEVGGNLLGACRTLRAILCRDTTAVRFWELISPNACRSEGAVRPLPALP